MAKKAPLTEQDKISILDEYWNTKNNTAPAIARRLNLSATKVDYFITTVLRKPLINPNDIHVYEYLTVANGVD